MTNKWICMILLSLLVLVNVYDVYSTKTLMSVGVKEGNPVVSYMIENIHEDSFVVFKALIFLWILSLMWRAKTERERKMITGGLSIVLIYYIFAMSCCNAPAMLMITGHL